MVKVILIARFGAELDNSMHHKLHTGKALYHEILEYKHCQANPRQYFVSLIYIPSVPWIEWPSGLRQLHMGFTAQRTKKKISPSLSMTFITLWLYTSSDAGADHREKVTTRSLVLTQCPHDT